MFLCSNLLSGQVSIWTGQFSPYWHQAGNWSNGQVPQAGSDLYIDPNADFAPEISLPDMSCNKLVMPPGSQLIILEGGTLEVDTFLLEGSIHCMGAMEANVLELMGQATLRSGAHAQINRFLRNGGVLSNRGIIVCHGDFENNYRLQNHGEMVLRGHYTDLSPNALNPITDYGHIHFQSTSPVPQTTNGRNKYNYITIEDIAGRQTFGSPVQIAGGLELIRGVLFPTGTLTLSDTATVSGGSDHSFVQGTIRRLSSRVEALDFPTGSNGQYRPIRLTRTNADPGSFIVTSFGEGYRNLSVVPAELDSVSSTEYWSISGNQPVNVKLFAHAQNGIDFLANSSRLVMSSFSTALGWSSEGADVVDFYERSLQVNNLVPNGYYTFGYAIPQVPNQEENGPLAMDLFNAPEDQITVADIHMEEPSTVQLELFNALGQLLYSEQVSALSQNIRILVPTADLPRGHYVLRARSATAQVSRLVPRL